VTVHTTDGLRFRPATVHVHVGTVRITVVDDGSYPHNLVLPALHRTSRTVAGNPGAERATFVVRVDRPGTYAFRCAYHASAGMRGSLVVSG
jgi:plastocyanin